MSTLEHQWIKAEVVRDTADRMASASHQYRRQGEHDKAREYMMTANVLTNIATTHTQSLRCFECSKPFASMSDVRIEVEDEGTNDIFWGPIHRDCQMRRESAWNSLRAETENIKNP